MLKKVSTVELRASIALITLIVLGFAGNYFGITLFFGVDLIFNSAAVLIITRLYGLPWGILSSLITGSYPLMLWATLMELFYLHLKLSL